MLKDRPQKDRVYKHFRAQGWLAQLEVPVTSLRGVSRNAPQVTDVDVLGIRASPELRWRYVIGDCKTRRKESPVNRVLWAAGLMEVFEASSGIVLLKRERDSQIERDHKLFADDRRILLVEEEEFGEYDRAVVYPSGSSAFPESIDAIEQLRDKTGEHFPRLREYLRWLYSEGWANSDHSVFLRTALGRARDVRGEIDPRREDHLAVVLEAASAFSVAFASLVGTVFRRHLKPNEREGLEDAARMIIWGGREQYEFYSRMRRDLAAARSTQLQEPLGLPEWDRFLELLRSALETPAFVFRCPQVLRSASLAVAARRPNPLGDTSDREVLHLAMRLGVYFARATGIPAEAADRIKAIFTPQVGEAVAQSARRASDGVGGQLDLVSKDGPAARDT